jgi:hypothetical protein
MDAMSPSPVESEDESEVMDDHEDGEDVNNEEAAGLSVALSRPRAMEIPC